MLYHHHGCAGSSLLATLPLLTGKQNKKIIFYDALPCGNALWVKAMISWDNGICQWIASKRCSVDFTKKPLSRSLSLRQFICWCSEASLVMEDLLTRVNRYLFENRRVCLAACERGILCLGVGASRGGCHSLHCALEPVSFYCTLVFVFSCGDMMDLAISLWEIIWTASTAIFRHEYFIII